MSSVQISLVLNITLAYDIYISYLDTVCNGSQPSPGLEEINTCLDNGTADFSTCYDSAVIE